MSKHHLIIALFVLWMMLSIIDSWVMILLSMYTSQCIHDYCIADLAAILVFASGVLLK